MPANCSLSFLTARTDLKFLEHTLPPLVAACRYEFAEVCLFLDTAPLGRAYRNRPGLGTLEDMRTACERLRSAGVVTRVTEIPYDRAEVRRVYDKYFAHHVRHTHNFRGYPIYGSLYAIDQTPGNYLAHFDSDMLLHAASDYSWVEAGIRLLEEIPEALVVTPRSGPPTKDGNLIQPKADFTHDPGGFYRFKTFTSRKYLLNRRRFEATLPHTPLYISQKRRWLSHLTGQSALWNWELVVENVLRHTDYIRAELEDPRAWTLHTPEHGPNFIRHLPTVLERVARGDYPAEQCGHYDLMLDAWVA